MAINLSSTATRLISSLAGDSSTTKNYAVVYEEGGQEDPDTGEWINGVTTTTVIDAAESSPNDTMLADTNILSSDKVLLVSADVSVPIGAYFTIRGDSFAIVGKQHIWNGGALQLQQFIVRSA